MSSLNGGFWTNNNRNSNKNLLQQPSFHSLSSSQYPYRRSSSFLTSPSAPATNSRRTPSSLSSSSPVKNRRNNPYGNTNPYYTNNFYNNRNKGVNYKPINRNSQGAVTSYNHNSNSWKNNRKSGGGGYAYYDVNQGNNLNPQQNPRRIPFDGVNRGGTDINRNNNHNNNDDGNNRNDINPDRGSSKKGKKYPSSVTPAPPPVIIVQKTTPSSLSSSSSESPVQPSTTLEIIPKGTRRKPRVQTSGKPKSKTDQEIQNLRIELFTRKESLEKIMPELDSFMFKLTRMNRKLRKRKMYFYDTLMLKTLRYSQEMQKQLENQLSKIDDAIRLVDSKSVRDSAWKINYVMKQVSQDKILPTTDKLAKQTSSKISELNSIVNDMSREHRLFKYS